MTIVALELCGSPVTEQLLPFVLGEGDGDRDLRIELRTLGPELECFTSDLDGPRRGLFEIRGNPDAEFRYRAAVGLFRFMTLRDLQFEVLIR